MRGNIIKIIAFFGCFLLLTPIFGQQKEALQQQRAAIQQQIEETNQLIAKNKQSTTARLSDVQLLNSKVQGVEALISTFEQEMAQLSSEINQTASSIKQNEEKLALLRETYSKSLVTAYKQKRSFNQLVFILSSKSFNSAIRRLNYLKQLNKHRARQATSLKETIALLDSERNKLIAQKNEKNNLLREQSAQKAKLVQSKERLQASIAELKQQGDRLTSMLQQKEQEEKQLQAQIRKVIAKEIEAERARREEAERKASTKLDEEAAEETTNEVEEKEERTVDVAPDRVALSSDFSSNRGKLPWPLTSGVIISSLGEYGDLVLPGIKKERDGIDIRTDENAAVTPIYAGQVRSVTTIPGFNRVVIVAHGDYYSVYGRLAEVNVVAGQQVSIDTVLGRVETKENVSELHLQIWRGQDRLDPKDWLRRK